MPNTLQEQQEQIAQKLSPQTMDEIYRACAQLQLRHGETLPGTEEDRMTYIVMLLESVAIMGFADALRLAIGEVNGHG